jgi:carboxyl-terminal processing protease
MSRQRIVVTTLVAAVAFFSGGWLMQQRDHGPQENVYQQARLFDDVLAHVADFYVDSVDERQLYRMAIDGMLRELHDPYTAYLDGRELRSLSEQTSGNYGGVGLQIEYRDGAIVVVAPLADTPAEHAGLMVGDRVVQVDDSLTAHWNQERAVNSLRGPVGSEVRLKVERPGVSAPITFRLTRAQIHARSVRLAALLGDGVGYIELYSFSESTAHELSQAIDSLKTAGMKALILDLRYNPGGLLDEGVSVADLFLDPGQMIVSTRGRAPNSTRQITDSQPQTYASLPLVVLVNGATASAAEIVAGALQDHDRAAIIGTTSYGKGLVQSVYGLSATASLKMTTSRWYTPSGRSIQRAIRPQVERDPDEEIARIDSAGRDSVYHTDHGRAMHGGGGIAPDLVVTQDSAEIAARNRLQQALDSGVTRYTDALAAFALNARAQHTLSGPTFSVSPSMRTQFLGMLNQRGVHLDASTIESSWPFISKQLGDQTARFAFGREGEIVRLSAGDDPVLTTARHLAGRAKSPQELLTLVAQATTSERAARP